MLPQEPETQAPAPATQDAAVAQFARKIQRAGARVVDEKRYPPEAKGKRWAGTSQIEVQFAAGGYIKRIVLAESCGHAPLDEKALEIARSVSFPDIPQDLRSRDFSVRFPIEFKPRKS
jgi:TonB family protein